MSARDGAIERPGEFEEGYYAAVYRNYAAQNQPRKLRFYRRLAEQAAAGAAGAPRVLDVGCAFGSFLGALPPAWERYGIEVSAFAIERARAALPGVALSTYDGLNIPYAGPFDVVTAFDVLEHVPHLDELLARLVDALAPGGALVVVVPVYDGPTGPIIRALDRDPTHVHKRERDFWLSKLGGRLHVEHWEGLYRYLLPGSRSLHLQTLRLRRFTPAIAVIARAERRRA